jgi:putative multiple sugar transport system permease protein
MSFFQDLQKVLRQNVREYGMYIALFVIMAIFTVLTNGLFLSPRNISNLINQTGYVAVLAVGMTLVIVIRHIDLSVGFLAGFLGAIAAILMVQVGLPTFAVVPIVLVIGIFAGLITSFLIVYFGIPAFVATLAGWLIYRGLLLQATMGTGTIIIPNAAFNAIGNGFIPDIPGLEFIPGHALTLLLGIVVIILFALGQFNDRKRKTAYGFEVLPWAIFILKLIFISAIIGWVAWVMAGYNGISWTAVIVLLVVGVYHFITTRTVLGRHIYAVAAIRRLLT